MPELFQFVGGKAVCYALNARAVGIIIRVGIFVFANQVGDL